MFSAYYNPLMNRNACLFWHSWQICALTSVGFIVTGKTGFETILKYPKILDRVGKIL